ncbi:MAG TPA: sugar ABC transporter substrate-binding protein [Armatimonadota bacterium]|jgi:multiple sugar transport system substrate-binding protein
MRNLTRVMLILALPVLLAAGCVQRLAPNSAATPTSGEPVKLVLFTWTEVTELQANQTLIAEFEKAHPNIKVDIQNVPGSGQAMQKLQTMISAGTAPDVMSLHGAYYFPFASKGVLADLETFIKGDKEFNLDDFYPGLIKISRWQGKLYSVPRYTSVYTLFYNKALFSAAGVPFPGASGKWTWDEYLAAAKKLTRGDEYGTYIDFWGARLYPWLWQNNADLMNADRTRCVVDSPAAVEALGFLSDLRHKYAVCPPATSGERNEGLNLFLQGKIAMYMTGPWDVQNMLQKPELSWDVAPLPTKQRAATLLGTENYSISATTPHPQEAWELYKFLLSPHAQEFMGNKLDKMPSRKSVAEGPYLAAPAKYNRKVFVDALAYALPAPNIPEWDEVSNYLQDQLDLIWVGKTTAAAGLKRAATDMNAALDKLRGQKG